MKRVLITGCNRGIGLELVKQLVVQPTPPTHVIATCRSIEKAKELQEIANINKNVHIIEIDVVDFKAYDDMTKKVSGIVGSNGLNVLINNAGITTKFTRLNMVKIEQMMDNFTINTLAPLMITKALAPFLKAAAAQNSSDPLGVSRAAIINISSILGSIGSNNKEGGFYPYRTSKAGINAITRSLSIDLKNEGVMAVSLHPGWVKTDMGGKQAPLTVQQSVYSILSTLNALKPEHNGTFLQHDGKNLPW